MPPSSSSRADGVSGGIIAILAMLAAFAPITSDMYLSGFPLMEDYFGVPKGGVEITLSTFFFGLAVGQAVYGPLIDRFGRRLPLLGGITLYVVATLLCLGVTDIRVFTGARFLQAVGGCSGMIIGRAIVTDLCDAKGSARTFSTLQVIMTLGPIIAPILGGSIITFGGWRPVFAFMLAFGLLCLLLVWRFIPETLPEAARHDRSNSESVLSTWRGLLARRAFVVPMVVGGIGQASMFAFITGSPFVFMGLHGATSRQYGFLFALIALSLIVFAQVNRVALKRYSPQTMLSVALTMTVAGALLSVLAVSTNSLVVLVATLWVAIGALGFLGANAVALAMAATGRSPGSGSALVGVFQFGCAFLVSSLVAAFQNGTAYPMTVAIALCATTAMSVRIVFGRKVIAQ